MNPTPSSALIDVSALLLYRDDEDSILPAVQALNSAFAPAAISLEIIPIDLGSGDNCNALMTLLPPMPASCELRAPVHVAAHSLFAPALREAHGRVLCVLDAAAAIASQGELVAAYGRVAARACDALRVAPNCLMLRRDRNERAMRSLFGVATAIHPRLVLAMKARGRNVAAAPQPAD